MEFTPQQIITIATIGGSVAGGAFAVVLKALSIIEARARPKKNGSHDSAKDRSEVLFGKQACPFDPVTAEAWRQVTQDIRETRQTVDSIGKKVESDAGDCLWRDRDLTEFRSLLQQAVTGFATLNLTVERLARAMEAE